MRKNVVLGLYDAPVWKDWIAWLTAFALFAGWRTVPQEAVAPYLFDLAFALLFQFALFGILPARIRKAVRSRRGRP